MGSALPGRRGLCCSPAGPAAAAALDAGPSAPASPAREARGLRKTSQEELLPRDEDALIKLSRRTGESDPGLMVEKYLEREHLAGAERWAPGGAPHRESVPAVLRAPLRRPGRPSPGEPLTSARLPRTPRPSRPSRASCPRPSVFVSLWSASLSSPSACLPVFLFLSHSARVPGPRLPHPLARACRAPPPPCFSRPEPVAASPGPSALCPPLPRVSGPLGISGPLCDFLSHLLRSPGPALSPRVFACVPPSLSVSSLSFSASVSLAPCVSICFSGLPCVRPFLCVSVSLRPALPGSPQWRTATSRSSTSSTSRTRGWSACGRRPGG